MRLSHITHLLYTPRRALSIGFAKFGAIFNYFCAIFYEMKAGGGGQLCVIRVFYGGRRQNLSPTPTENRRGFPTKRRSRINGSANHLPDFFLHKRQ